MANTVIQLKKSSIPSASPASLANGELAINYADGKLYYKNVAGYIVELTSSGGGNYFGTVNANGTLVIADTTGDVLTLVAGSGIQITGDAINDSITISATPGGDTTVAAAAYDKANAANIIASSAYDKANAANVLAFNTGIGANNWANTKLSNATVTLAGSLTTTGNVTVLGNSYYAYANSTNTFAYSFYNVTSQSIDTVFP